MSAFVVERKTIDRVVAAVIQLRSEALYSLPGGAGMEILLSCDGIIDGLNALGKALWEMNAQAVAQRYEEDPAQLPEYRYEGVILPWLNPPGREALFQMAKSIHCLEYQCHEGDVPKTPLYQWLVSLEHAFSNYLVTRDPLYDLADWG